MKCKSYQYFFFLDPKLVGSPKDFIIFSSSSSYYYSSSTLTYFFSCYSFSFYLSFSFFWTFELFIAAFGIFEAVYLLSKSDCQFLPNFFYIIFSCLGLNFSSAILASLLATTSTDTAYTFMFIPSFLLWAGLLICVI